MAASSGLRSQRQQTEKSWQTWLENPADTEVRDDVKASWERSKEAVSLEIESAPSDESLTPEIVWKEHILQEPVKTLEPDLQQLAVDGGFVIAITNENSTILWTTGSKTMQDRAARANFAPGGRWDEASVGTNALDLALRTQKAQSVFSAEHFAPLVHQWVCYSAPIVDPRTGNMLGVLDLSTTWDNANPLAMRTTVAMVGLLQHELSKVALKPLAGEIHLNLLGKPSLTLGGMKISASRRQLEICALLALHPQGLSLDELHLGLYGDVPVSTTTLKAEVSHLRSLLQGGIASRPYRLTSPVVCDVLTAMSALRVGNFSAAMAAYSGPLLPNSDSPLINDLRNWMDVAMREGALRSLDVDAISAYLDVHPYDLEVAEYLATRTAESDARYPYVRAKLLQARGSF